MRSHSPPNDASFVATKSMNHIHPKQHFHFPKSPPTSSRVLAYTNTKTAKLHPVLPDPLHRMTASKLQTCIYGSSSKLHTLRIQFQTQQTTSTTKTKTTAGSRGTRRNSTYRSQLSLPRWIGPSLRREGTPLNPRSGEVGSRHVEWRTGRQECRIQHNLPGLNKPRSGLGRTGAAVYPSQLGGAADSEGQGTADFSWFLQQLLLVSYRRA